MLRILGHTQPAAVCSGHAKLAGRGRDGISRREVMQVGGLSLFGSLTLPQLLRSAQAAGVSKPESLPGPAKSVILLNLFGGPPHMDMFDLKPNAPANIRGEMSPIDTSVPGLQICELLPQTAQLMDRASLIRTYSHNYNSHNPYNVLTGFDGGNDRENYFAKRTDHPSIGSICQYLDIGAEDVPRYVMMPAFPGYTQSLRRAGPYGGYLGSQYDPLFTVCDPKVARESKDDYDPVVAYGEPVLPSLEELTDVTANRLDRRQSLLDQLDANVKAVEGSRAAQSMTRFQEQVFSILTAPKTRNAFDLSRESDRTRDRYGRNLWGSSMLIARRLVEAGTTFITIHWESKGKNHWDLHGNNFGMLRSHLPQLDQLTGALIPDLEERGLLDSTLVVIMGEMGRTPRINGKSGRDHWPQCGFSLIFGGGTKRGMVLGKTDKQAAYPTDRPVSAGDVTATIYHALGVDPTLTVDDLSGRPIHVSHGGEPVWEILA
ncbi:MAG: hypothetical protein CMJ78_14705 [Planctomycetaceae bacterium]|nr:hypothetical protein [Planctomycetaceae bacterium]